MAITYPRTLPHVPFKSCDFKLNPGTVQNRNRIGKVIAIENATPRWTAKYVTIALDRDQRQIVTSWWNSLRGLRRFYAYDADRYYPINYRDGFVGLSKHGGGAFDGTATVEGVTSSTIQLSGLPSTFALKAGDMIGLVQGDLRALHEIVEDATATDGAVTVTVTPPVLTGLYTAPTANFAGPVCVMIPVMDTLEAAASVDRAPVSFEGEQAVF